MPTETETNDDTEENDGGIIGGSDTITINTGEASDTSPSADDADLAPDSDREVAFSFSVVFRSIEYKWNIISHQTLTDETNFFTTLPTKSTPDNAFGLAFHLSDVENRTDDLDVNIGLSDYLGLTYNFSKKNGTIYGTGVSINFGFALAMPFSINKPTPPANNTWGYSIGKH